MNTQTSVIGVFHRNLQRVGDSVHKSECPFCFEGVLPMRRDDGRILLLIDYCLSCGVPVRYLDVKPGCQGDVEYLTIERADRESGFKYGYDSTDMIPEPSKAKAIFQKPTEEVCSDGGEHDWRNVKLSAGYSYYFCQKCGLEKGRPQIPPSQCPP